MDMAQPMKTAVSRMFLYDGSLYQRTVYKTAAMKKNTISMSLLMLEDIKMKVGCTATTDIAMILARSGKIKRAEKTPAHQHQSAGRKARNQLGGLEHMLSRYVWPEIRAYSRTTTASAICAKGG